MPVSGSTVGSSHRSRNVTWERVRKAFRTCRASRGLSISTCVKSAEASTSSSPASSSTSAISGLTGGRVHPGDGVQRQHALQEPRQLFLPAFDSRTVSKTRRIPKGYVCRPGSVVPLAVPARAAIRRETLRLDRAAPSGALSPCGPGGESGGRRATFPAAGGPPPGPGPHLCPSAYPSVSPSSFSRRKGALSATFGLTAPPGAGQDGPLRDAAS